MKVNLIPECYHDKGMAVFAANHIKLKRFHIRKEDTKYKVVNKINNTLIFKENELHIGVIDKDNDGEKVLDKYKLMYSKLGVEFHINLNSSNCRLIVVDGNLEEWLIKAGKKSRISSVKKFQTASALKNHFHGSNQMYSDKRVHEYLDELEQADSTHLRAYLELFNLITTP